MVLPPLPSLLIIVGLILSSVVIFNRAKRAGLLGRRLAVAVSCLSGLLLVTGLLLHLGSTAAVAPSSADSARATASRGVARPSPWAFSFEPKAVRWGEDVTLRVTPPIEKIEVYLNGVPIPCRTLGGGAFAATVPTISKSGRLSILCDGTRVQASEGLLVSPR